MKKIIIIILFLPLIFNSCKKEDDQPSNTTGTTGTTGTTSVTTTHDWYFEIKVDGNVNRIEGTFDNSYSQSTGWPFLFQEPNKANISFVSSGAYISAILANKGESTYIDGENFSISMSVNNLDLGINYMQLTENHDAYSSSIGVTGEANALSLGTNGIYNGFLNYPIDTNTYINNVRTFPINITQLSSSTNSNSTPGSYDIGNPLIGSGAATIYVLTSTTYPTTSPFTWSYTTAYNIEINFKLYQL